MGKKFKPSLAETLNIKWCTIFRLLGREFNNTLSDMDSNYDKGISTMKEVSNDQKFHYLMIFSKNTVIKTFMLPKLTHITMVVPKLSARKLDKI